MARGVGHFSLDIFPPDIFPRTIPPADVPPAHFCQFRLTYQEQGKCPIIIIIIIIYYYAEAALNTKFTVRKNENQ